MNKVRVSLDLLLSLTLALTLLTLTQVAAADDIVFREIGTLQKECPASSSVQYEWFIYNDMNASYLVEISVAPSSGPGWSSELNQPIYVLDPGQVAFINLTVSASAETTSKTVDQTVVFQFTDLSNYTESGFNQSSLISTEMIPTWSVIAPGKNKLLGRYDSPLPAPLDGNYMTFLLNMGIWACVALVFAFVVNPAVHYFTKKTKTDLDDRILKIVHKPIFVLVMIYGLVSSLSILQLTEREVRVTFEVYGIFLIAIVTYIVYKIFKEIIIYMGKRWAARTKTEIDDVLIPVMEKIGGLVILIFGMIAIVNYMGYDITFLLAGVGVFGLVIAFAAQDALSNFFSGIFMLLDRPFVEGDFVLLTSGETCRVDKIGIRSTRLYDVFQNNYVVLPNNKLVNDKIVNLSEPDQQGVTEIVVSVAPGSNIDKVESVLMDVAKKHKEVVQETGRGPAVRFTNFGESSLEFRIYIWVSDFMRKHKVAHELRKEINRRFVQEDIELAVPRRSVLINETKK
jgi:small-conductance mechanosensitive channel